MPQAIAIPLAVAASSASIGASVVQGRRQARAAKRSVQEQAEASRLARNRAAAEQRRAAQAERRQNRKRPDLIGLLAREQAAAGSGVSSTLLSGAGARGAASPLARTSLLGG